MLIKPHDGKCDVQYADRMPIGQEKIIQHAPASTVKAFYERWYRPENMAIIATGDLDTDEVVNIIKQQLGPGKTFQLTAKHAHSKVGLQDCRQSARFMLMSLCMQVTKGTGSGMLRQSRQQDLLSMECLAVPES